MEKMFIVENLETKEKFVAFNVVRDSSHPYKTVTCRGSTYHPEENFKNEFKILKEFTIDEVLTPTSVEAPKITENPRVKRMKFYVSNDTFSSLMDDNILSLSYHSQFYRKKQDDLPKEIVVEIQIPAKTATINEDEFDKMWEESVQSGFNTFSIENLKNKIFNRGESK